MPTLQSTIKAGTYRGRKFKREIKAKEKTLPKTEATIKKKQRIRKKEKDLLGRSGRGVKGLPSVVGYGMKRIGQLVGKGQPGQFTEEELEAQGIDIQLHGYVWSGVRADPTGGDDDVKLYIHHDYKYDAEGNLLSAPDTLFGVSGQLETTGIDRDGNPYTHYDEEMVDLSGGTTERGHLPKDWQGAGAFRPNEGFRGTTHIPKKHPHKEIQIGVAKMPIVVPKGELLAIRDEEQAEEDKRLEAEAKKGEMAYRKRRWGDEEEGDPVDEGDEMAQRQQGLDDAGEVEQVEVAEGVYEDVLVEAGTGGGEALEGGALGVVGGGELDIVEEMEQWDAVDTLDMAQLNLGGGADIEALADDIGGMDIDDDGDTGLEDRFNQAVAVEEELNEARQERRRKYGETLNLSKQITTTAIARDLSRPATDTSQISSVNFGKVGEPATSAEQAQVDKLKGKVWREEIRDADIAGGFSRQVLTPLGEKVKGDYIAGKGTPTQRRITELLFGHTLPDTFMKRGEGVGLHTGHYERTDALMEGKWQTKPYAKKDLKEIMKQRKKDYGDKAKSIEEQPPPPQYVLKKGERVLTPAYKERMYKGGLKWDLSKYKDIAGNVKGTNVGKRGRAKPTQILDKKTGESLLQEELEVAPKFVGEVEGRERVAYGGADPRFPVKQTWDEDAITDENPLGVVNVPTEQRTTKTERWDKDKDILQKRFRGYKIIKNPDVNAPPSKRWMVSEEPMQIPEIKEVNEWEVLKASETKQEKRDRPFGVSHKGLERDRPADYDPWEGYAQAKSFAKAGKRVDVSGIPIGSNEPRSLRKMDTDPKIVPIKLGAIKEKQYKKKGEKAGDMRTTKRGFLETTATAYAPYQKQSKGISAEKESAIQSLRHYERKKKDALKKGEEYVPPAEKFAGAGFQYGLHENQWASDVETREKKEKKTKPVLKEIGGEMREIIPAFEKTLPQGKYGAMDFTDNPVAPIQSVLPYWEAGGVWSLKEQRESQLIDSGDIEDVGIESGFAWRDIEVSGASGSSGKYFSGRVPKPAEKPEYTEAMMKVGWEGGGAEVDRGVGKIKEHPRPPHTAHYERLQYEEKSGANVITSLADAEGVDLLKKKVYKGDVSMAETLQLQPTSPDDAYDPWMQKPSKHGHITKKNPDFWEGVPEEKKKAWIALQKERGEPIFMGGEGAVDRTKRTIGRGEKGERAIGMELVGEFSTTEYDPRGREGQEDRRHLVDLGKRSKGGEVMMEHKPHKGEDQMDVEPRRWVHARDYTAGGKLKQGLVDRKVYKSVSKLGIPIEGGTDPYALEKGRIGEEVMDAPYTQEGSEVNFVPSTLRELQNYPEGYTPIMYQGGPMPHGEELEKVFLEDQKIRDKVNKRYAEKARKKKQRRPAWAPKGGADYWDGSVRKDISKPAGEKDKDGWSADIPDPRAKPRQFYREGKYVGWEEEKKYRARDRRGGNKSKPVGTMTPVAMSEGFRRVGQQVQRFDLSGKWVNVDFTEGSVYPVGIGEPPQPAGNMDWMEGTGVYAQATTGRGFTMEQDIDQFYAHADAMDFADPWINLSNPFA